MSLSRLILESLEPRIAPAVIYAGPASAGSSSNPPPSGSVATDQYAGTSNGTTTHFALAAAAPVLSGTGTLGGFTTDNYYIPLKSGDTLYVYGSSGLQSNALTITGGAAEAFFTDFNHNGYADSNELTGLAVTAGAKIALQGLDVHGDIVANLTAKTLSDPTTWTISANNLVSNKQTISSLNTGGNIYGSIIAGGSISNVTAGIVSGTIQSGLTANKDYTFGGSTGVGAGTLIQFSSDSTQGTGYLPAAKLTGGSLSNITIQSATGLYGGGGGAGAAGGGISHVTILSDASGIVIQGGHGGNGSGSVISGGAGGAVSQVVMKGVTDSTNNDLIQIAGGAGGDALAGSTGSGGVGGAVSKIWVGYEYNTAKTSIVVSSNWLHDNVTVEAGDGGAGASAGNGGSITSINLVTATPLSASGAHDIQLLGGDGGSLTGFVAKKAGAGGSVTTFNIQDPNPDSSTYSSSTVYVAGGDASASSGSPVTGTGAAGGSVNNSAGVTLSNQLAPLTGESFIFQGGHGSNTQGGGGAGGSVSNIVFDYYSDAFLLQSLVVNSGTGGDATTGNGGAGGSITNISAPNSDLTTLTLATGSGGNSLGNGTTGGVGGAGGSINSAKFQDSGKDTYVDLSPVAGNGGNGFKGGGAGGSIQNFNYIVKNEPSQGHSALASLVATAGNGGSVLGTQGNGGAGGSLSGIALTALVVDSGGHTQTATLNAGSGGNAKGTGTGGAGGSITDSSVQIQDSVSFVAGTGGNSNGDKGKVGAGGSIGSSSSSLGAFAKSLQSNVSFQAGNAGSVTSGTPSAGAAGGSILTARALALGNISYVAGTGSVGGNGGDISQIAFAGTDGVSSSTGTISVIAGSGGNAISSTTAAGRGGNLTNLSGYTSTDTTAADAAFFRAGDGGSGGKGGAGGTLTGLTIYGGAQGFSVQAGDGGSGTASGGVGGSVTTVNSKATGVEDAIAAGNGGSITASAGGSTTAKGANGGSITNVNVASDIGIRTGQNYGFATNGTAMGGLFAGTAGINNNSGANASKTTGTAGNVTGITAQAISAIVAGRASSPQLVNKVDNIYLTGETALKANSDGSYNNFGSANFVGGKEGSPSSTSAVNFLTSTTALIPSGSIDYQWNLGTTVPLDGLIAALTLTGNRNFTATALLTTDTSQSSGYGLYLTPVPLA